MKRDTERYKGSTCDAILMLWRGMQMEWPLWWFHFQLHETGRRSVEGARKVYDVGAEEVKNTHKDRVATKHSHTKRVVNVLKRAPVFHVQSRAFPQQHESFLSFFAFFSTFILQISSPFGVALMSEEELSQKWPLNQSQLREFRHIYEFLRDYHRKSEKKNIRPSSPNARRRGGFHFLQQTVDDAVSRQGIAAKSIHTLLNENGFDVGMNKCNEIVKLWSKKDGRVIMFEVRNKPPLVQTFVHIDVVRV